MSAVAAMAAVGTWVPGQRRRQLRAVPDQAGPVAQLELGNPLQLSKTMRARLLAAVLALVSDAALEGAGDPARLAAVVLMAKAKVATGYRATLTAKELGRWVGLKPSRVAHHVLPALRERGVLGSRETVSAAGRVTGLECWVIPMYRAQQAGDRRHVLALSRVELAVLLRLIEVLFGPGWAHRDGSVTPAGLLADRTGRGAATDRLGLLLMVLSSTSRGWLQLCPGSVDTSRGRPAATVARLLGCSPAAGAKVLSRLQEQDVLAVERRETASGLNARSRVRLLPVTQAHGVAVWEAREAADAVFSDLAGTAPGDHEVAVEAVSPVVTGVQGAGEGLETGSADRADAAHLHASHAPVVAPVVPPQLSGGFSGEGRGGEGRRPERACVREDQAADGETASAGSAPTVAEDGPLRGEKPKKSPVNERDERRAPRAQAGGRPKAVTGEKAQQRVALPADLGLRVALGPVAWLWERLNGWQQDQVEEAAKRELGRLKNLLMQPEAAPRLLADRLTDRLEETGGEALVDSPFGWITRRGLVQRPACSDMRCDDGIRLDTGGDCDNCGNVIHLRRARRARIAAEIDRELPGLGKHERRQVLEGRLREQARWEAARATAPDEADARHGRVATSTADPGFRRHSAGSRAVGAVARVAREASVPEAPVVCGVCRTAAPVDSLSAVCGSCAREMRGLLAPELERLNGDGQRLLMRLMSGSEHQPNSRSWRCKVPSCSRRQIGVPPASGRCAPCDREAAGKPPPWEGRHGRPACRTQH
ncbi:hypothetical protein JOF35_000081 [Streptomyces demainii]|uniref:Helix-turn-helix domain-containing protein n=1 Tax=Streptomyces demainii TaxID=588122 RepID=A0ABT9KHB6_9ACTN|nr:hypothetical protein [Streptomyces demainii]